MMITYPRTVTAKPSPCSPVIVVVVGEAEVAAVGLVHQLPQMRVRRRLKTELIEDLYPSFM